MPVFELIYEQNHLPGGRVKLLAEDFDDGGEVHAVALGAHEHWAATGQRLADQKQGGSAFTGVLSAHTLDLFSLDGPQITHLGEQLFGILVQADLRAGRIKPDMTLLDVNGIS